MYILNYAVEEKDITLREWETVDIDGLDSFKKAVIEYKDVNSVYINMFRMICQTNFEERLLKIDKSIKTLFEEENPGHMIRLFQVEKIHRPDEEESLESFEVDSNSNAHYNIFHSPFKNKNGIQFNAKITDEEDFEMKLEDMFIILREEYNL